MISLKKIYFIKPRLKSIFIIVAIVIVILSILFTNRLVKSLTLEEHKKMEIWAEALRQFIMANENTNVDFFSNIIANNTTIPVIMTDVNNNLLSSLNVKEPSTHVDKFYKKEIERFKRKNPPIEVRLDNTI